VQFSQSFEHDFLKKFRKSSKNWHWPVVTKKCWIICLENRNYFSNFERFRKHTSRCSKRLIIDTRGWTIFLRDWWIIFMDILSCPGALLTLNGLTMLLNLSTVSGCNEMDSERERHKKLLGEEFVGEILLENLTWCW